MVYRDELIATQRLLSEQDRVNMANAAVFASLNTSWITRCVLRRGSRYKPFAAPRGSWSEVISRGL